MSWETINQILGSAVINRAFAQELLDDPLKAIQAQGFQLTDEEKQAFRESTARDLQELSQYLQQRLQHKQ